MILIKRGDTFQFLADMTDGTGNPLTISALNIRSQIRDTKYKLITELTVESTNVVGTYKFSTPSTDTWPTSIHDYVYLLCDIQVTDNGVITSSGTFRIKVEKDVTFDE